MNTGLPAGVGNSDLAFGISGVPELQAHFTKGEAGGGGGDEGRCQRAQPGRDGTLVPSSLSGGAWTRRLPPRAGPSRVQL